jgi:hypothetical protein
MPENRTYPVNRSPKEDSSQINEHLNDMPIDKLTDALADMWDAADDFTYSAAEMDACLEEIEQIEAAPEFDVNASLNRFLDKHSRLVECASRTSKKSRPNTSRWKPSVAAAIAVLVVLGSLVTAQALGIDVFGAIARWTDETFRFTSSLQNSADTDSDTQNSNKQSPDGEYTSLRDALDACGINQSIVPKWLPEGFELAKVSVSSQPSPMSIRAKYTFGNRNFSLIIFLYDSTDAVDCTVFEKDSATVTTYERGELTYYIMSNNQRLTAAWMPNDQMVCTIVGDLSVDEVKQIIDFM